MKNLIKSVTSEWCEITHYDTLLTKTDGISIKIVFEKDGDVPYGMSIRTAQLKYPQGSTHKIFDVFKEPIELHRGMLKDITLKFDICNSNVAKKGMLLIISLVLYKEPHNLLTFEYEFDGKNWIEKEKKS